MSESNASDYIQILCQYPDRRLGSKSNQAATEWVAGQMESLGWSVSRQLFDCIDWVGRSTSLVVDGRDFKVKASPYSTAVDVTAQLVCASTFPELEDLPCQGKILLLLGDIAREPLMPKNFPFYNPEGHQKLITLLETKAPAAILSATGRHPGLAGGLYPFPMIEDGDFDIPSAYLTDNLGLDLAELHHHQARLTMDVERIPSTGANAIASRSGSGSESKLVLCAHLDTKMGTPGALDNAGGVSVLLLMAEKLKGYSGHLGIDLIVFNGEDYFGASGEKAYLGTLRTEKDDVILAVNLDAAGYHHGLTAYSLYGCSDRIAKVVDATFSRHPELEPGDLWYQSDHMVFAQNDVPAMAITSQQFSELTASITHTDADTPELVDGSKLEAIAGALVDLLEHFNLSDAHQ